VHGGNRKSIADRVAELVFSDDPVGIDLAKQAGFVSESVGGQNVTEIGVVPVTLVRVACDAERLKIAQIVTAAFGARHDMVDMQGCLFFMGPT
jgi:hypothetical protein